MYIDESLLDTVLRKDNPKAVWPSPEHRTKAVALIMYNRRIDDIETFEKVVKAVCRVPSAELKNITFSILENKYGCPKVW